MPYVPFQENALASCMNEWMNEWTNDLQKYIKLVSLQAHHGQRNDEKSVWHCQSKTNVPCRGSAKRQAQTSPVSSTSFSSVSSLVLNSVFVLTDGYASCFD